MIGYTKDTPLNLWFIHYVSSLVVCSQWVDPHGRITLLTVTTSHWLAQHWFRGPGSGTWHCFHYFNTESILYQLNQFVGHMSQASSIWRKVTAVTPKITKNLKKGSKIEKFPNIVNWRNHNFIRQVTGHTGWRIDLIWWCTILGNAAAALCHVTQANRSQMLRHCNFITTTRFSTIPFVN